MNNQLRQFVASVTMFSMVAMQMPVTVLGQEAPPPPAGDASALADAPIPSNFHTAAELDAMLAPIALYPDPLLAQILPAATAPSDIVLANRFLLAKKDPALIDQQPWNESVKALARYPDVIKMMDDKLDWTTELGQVYLAQPDDVFASVQNLRSQAAAVGNLKDTPQQVIVHEKEIIQIQPADPQIIYVPTYPTTIYTAPPPDPLVPLLAFSAGLAVGIWLHNDHYNYWYGRGPYYRGGGYHHGNYYGGGNSINIDNSNNINIGNGNNNGNRPGNGGNRPGNGGNGGNGQRPGGGNGQRPPGNGNGIGGGNGQRPGGGNGNGNGNGNRPGPGNGAGNQRPGGGNGGGLGGNNGGNQRPGAGNGGGNGGGNQRPSPGGGAGGNGGNPQRPQTRPAGGAQQRPAGGGGGLFNRDASKPQQNRGNAGGGRGAGAQRPAPAAKPARGGGGGAAPARGGGGGGGAARGGGGGGAARGGGGGGGGGRGGR